MPIGLFELTEPKLPLYETLPVIKMPLGVLVTVRVGVPVTVAVKVLVEDTVGL